jgi:SHS2 domain-containing protein
MFELLEHPADIGFRVFGATPSELFANAAIAMLSIAADPAQVEPRQSWELTAEGSDYESLLVNWLNEVLFWFDGKHIAFRDFTVHHIEPGGIHATGRGEPRDAARHTARLVVKAVTYHQLKVAPTPEGWVAEVYLDI